jgi:hypothetical protein
MELFADQIFLSGCIQLPNLQHQLNNANSSKMTVPTKFLHFFMRAPNPERQIIIT